VSPRKARRRLNRRAVGWYLFGFMAVQIGLGALVERSGAALRDSVFERNAARLAARRAEYPDRPLLLALGSSRTLTGLDAGRITRADGRRLVFNMGELGAGPMVEQVFLRRLLGRGTRPDALLLELTPMQMATYSLVPPEESSLDTGRLTAAELRLVSQYYRFRVTSSVRWLQARGLPCLSRQRELHAALNVDSIDMSGGETEDDFGYLAKPRLSPAKETVAFQAVFNDVGDKLMNSSLADGPARAFRDLIGLCRREHLPFAVVLMPESEHMRQLHPPQFLADLDRYLADLRCEADFRLIDARAWVADADFQDPHHLHVGGAAVFSDRLMREWLADWSPGGSSWTGGVVVSKNR
jgi:hypothetical protein